MPITRCRCIRREGRGGMSKAMKIRMLTVAALLAALPLFAEEDISRYLGMEPQEAIAELGAPAEIFSLRGESADEDDVVFYYSRHLYLFWFRNRVWQVRLDRRYAGAILGLKMKAERREVLEVLGSPLAELEDSLIFQIEDRGYPVRLRLFFHEDTLVDVYCYRGDY
jgi:hypothetical protein